MSKSSGKKTSSSSVAWWQDQLANPRLTALIVMAGISALVIHQLLPWPLKFTLASIVTYPIVTVVILVGIMVLGYFNWVAGLVLLGLLVFVLLPYNRRVMARQHERSRNKEGFTSSDSDDFTIDNSDDMTDTSQIKSLFQPGFLRKKLEDARSLNREVSDEHEARNKMERFLDKRAKNSQGQGQGQRHGKEKFVGVQGDKAIPMRRFNPGSEEDANLLLTMDAMDDIKDRIKYKYEDKKYLKRYIRQKLEEVVDLLDLVHEED